MEARQQCLMCRAWVALRWRQPDTALLPSLRKTAMPVSLWRPKVQMPPYSWVSLSSHMGQKMGQLEAPKRGYSEKYLGTPNFISLTAFTSHLQYKCSILLSDVNLFLAPNVPFDKSK